MPQSLEGRLAPVTSNACFIQRERPEPGSIEGKIPAEEYVSLPADVFKTRRDACSLVVDSAGGGITRFLLI